MEELYLLLDAKCKEFMRRTQEDSIGDDKKMIQEFQEILRLRQRIRSIRRELVARD